MVYFYQKILIIFILLFSVFGWVSVTGAETDTLLKNTAGQNCNCQIDYSSFPADYPCKQYCGDYQLNDFVSLLIKAAEIILSVVGSLVLLMLVYGGTTFIISAGNSETVDRAKKIIVGSIVGLLIVFLSYTIIDFAAKSLGVQGNIFQVNWLNKK